MRTVHAGHRNVSQKGHVPGVTLRVIAILNTKTKEHSIFLTTQYRKIVCHDICQDSAYPGSAMSVSDTLRAEDTPT